MERTPARHAAPACLLLALGLALLRPSPLLAQEGDVDLWLSAASGGRYYNRLAAGEDNLVFLHLHNGGDQAVADIRLSTLHPEGWDIDIDPDSVNSLGSGRSLTVDVTIVPPTGTAASDHSITFVAEADEIREILVFNVVVEAPEGYWLWVGGIVALVVVAGFVFVFLRLGRNSAASARQQRSLEEDI